MWHCEAENLLDHFEFLFNSHFLYDLIRNIENYDQKIVELIVDLLFPLFRSHSILMISINSNGKKSSLLRSSISLLKCPFTHYSSDFVNFYFFIFILLLNN